MAPDIFPYHVQREVQSAGFTHPQCLKACGKGLAQDGDAYGRRGDGMRDGMYAKRGHAPAALPVRREGAPRIQGHVDTVQPPRVCRGQVWTGGGGGA